MKNPAEQHEDIKRLRRLYEVPRNNDCRLPRQKKVAKKVSKVIFFFFMKKVMHYFIIALMTKERSE